MSRTYRRKKVKQLPWWVASEWDWNESITGWQHQRRYFEGKELAKADAEYHSDSGDYSNSQIPSWFCTLWGHRHDRRASKRALHKEFYALEKGDVVFDKTINIDWQWW